MTWNPFRRRFTGALCGVTFLISVPCGHVLADTHAQLSLQAADSRADFIALLTTIATSHKVGIVAESVPLVPVVEDTQVVQMVGDSGISVSEKINAVARLFDYRVVQKPGAFLLVKRHTSPLDFPEVSSGEVKASLKQFVTVLNTFAPPVDPDLYSASFGTHEELYLARQLFASFTPEQRSQLADEKNIIRVRDLPESQRKLALRLAISMDMGDFRAEATRLTDYLTWGEGGTVLVSPDSQETFGLSGMRPDGNGIPVRIFEAFQSPASLVMDRQSVDEQCQQLLGHLDNGGVKEVITLGGLAERLSSRASSGNITFSVEETLRDKRVVMVGTGASAPALQFTWAASVYGLHVKNMGPSVRKITSPPLLLAADATRLFRCLRDTLSAPLLTFYRDGELDVLRLGRDAALQTGYYNSPPPDVRDINESTIRDVPKLAQQYAACLLNLRMASVQKRSPGAFPMPVSQISPTQRSWIVNYHISKIRFFPSFAVHRKGFARIVTELNDFAVVAQESDQNMYLGFFRISKGGAERSATMTFNMSKGN